MGWTGLDQDVEWFPTATIGDRVTNLGDQRGCTGIVLATADTAAKALHRVLTSGIRAVMS
jgi:hypothetical protein